jgi:hypothetical protein
VPRLLAVVSTLLPVTDLVRAVNRRRSPRYAPSRLHHLVDLSRRHHIIHSLRNAVNATTERFTTAVDCNQFSEPMSLALVNCSTTMVTAGPTMSANVITRYVVDDISR